MKIFLVFLALILATNANLTFVVELFRHGSRGPLNTFYDGSQQPYMWGELTATGQRQHYMLGQQLRQEYIIQQQFLNPSYNHTEMFVRSTDVNRTLNSAASQLYGMFPIGTGPSVPRGINQSQLMPPYNGTIYKPIGENALPNFFQGIVIHTVADNSEDTLLNPYGTCPKIDSLIDQWRSQQPQVDQLNFISQQLSQTLTTLGQILQSTNVNLNTITQVYDIFVVDKYQNRPWPDGLTPEIWKNLTFLNDYMGFYNMKYNVAVGLLNTVAIQSLVDQLDGIYYNTTQTPALKWVMLSAHDTNIIVHSPIFNLTSADCIADLFFNGSTSALNCFGYPQFAANLLIELYKNDTSNDYYVQLRYNGKYMYLCERQSTTCAYSEFRQRLLNSIYTDQSQFDQLCGISSTQSKFKVEEQIKNSEINYINLVWIVLVVVLIKVFINSVSQKKSQNKAAYKLVEFQNLQQPVQDQQVLYNQNNLNNNNYAPNYMDNKVYYVNQNYNNNANQINKNFGEFYNYQFN